MRVNDCWVLSSYKNITPTNDLENIILDKIFFDVQFQQMCAFSWLTNDSTLISEYQ